MNTSAIHQGRIFFLGAGFSAGAGLPLTNALLPLAAALFRSEAPGLFERISWWASSVDVDLDGSPDALQFSRFCTFLDFMELREFAGGERWSDEGSRERVALKFFLAKAIALSTPNAANLPRYYIDFVAGLRPGDAVVTFNWDTLLENTFDYIGREYSYGGNFEAVQIIKLHGSVNWAEKPQAIWRSGHPVDYVAMGFGDDLAAKEIYSSKKLLMAEEWKDRSAMTDGVWPLLVLPGYGKAVDARLLSSLWYRPEMLNIRGGGISIIGLSVADDDYIMDGLFRYLFRATFSADREIRVINPDDQVGRKFDALAGTELGVRFLQARFDEGSLRKALIEEDL